MATGTYELQRVVAAGVYGIVCVARDTEAGRVVALKVLQQRFADSDEANRRARDEARILSRLRHPNIVECHGLHRVDGRPVAVLEFVDGVSLEAVFNAHGPFPEAVVIAILRRMSAAVDAGFRAPVGPKGRPLRVVHGDLKPANTLLTAEGVLKVIDYGSAQSVLSRPVASEGSPGYLAPERGSGLPMGVGADVYGVGATGYALTTGRHLPMSPDPTAHAGAVAAALAAWGRHPVRDGLAAIVAAACAHGPGDRPGPDELVEQLAALQRTHRLSDDLRPFGAATVPPLLAHGDPADGELFADVAFLKSIGSDTETAPLAVDRALRLTDYADAGTQRIRPERGLPRASGEEADREVRAFLEREDWAQRMPDLRRLLAARPAWTAAPFIEVVRAYAPWWQFWSPGPSPDQLVAALRVLVERPGPDVAALGQGLVDHHDPAVAMAAAALTRAGRR